MQNKTTRRYRLAPGRMAIINKAQITNAAWGVEKKEPSCTVGGNESWYNYYRDQYGGTLVNYA